MDYFRYLAHKEPSIFWTILEFACDRVEEFLRLQLTAKCWWQVTNHPTFYEKLVTGPLAIYSYARVKKGPETFEVLDGSFFDVVVSDIHDWPLWAWTDEYRVSRMLWTNVDRRKMVFERLFRFQKFGAKFFVAYSPDGNLAIKLENAKPIKEREREAATGGGTRQIHHSTWIDVYRLPMLDGTRKRLDQPVRRGADEFNAGLYVKEDFELIPILTSRELDPSSPLPSERLSVFVTRKFWALHNGIPLAMDKAQRVALRTEALFSVLND